MAAEIAQRARALPRHAEPVVVGRIARPGDEGEKRIAVTDQREVATQLDPDQVAARAVRDHPLPLAELRQPLELTPHPANAAGRLLPLGRPAPQRSGLSFSSNLLSP